MMLRHCHVFKPDEIHCVSQGIQFQEHIQHFLIPRLFRGQDEFISVGHRDFTTYQSLSEGLETLNNRLLEMILGIRILHLVSIVHHLDEKTQVKGPDMATQIRITETVDEGNRGNGFQAGNIGIVL